MVVGKCECAWRAVIAVIARAVRIAREEYGVPTLIVYLPFAPAYLRQTGCTDSDIMQKPPEAGAEIIGRSIDPAEGLGRSQRHRPRHIRRDRAMKPLCGLIARALIAIARRPGAEEAANHRSEPAVSDIVVLRFIPGALVIAPALRSSYIGARHSTQ
jgi:hypothetical protein